MRLSLSLSGVAGRYAGGPMTTEGWMLDMEKKGYRFRYVNWGMHYLDVDELFSKSEMRRRTGTLFFFPFPHGVVCGGLGSSIHDSSCLVGRPLICHRLGSRDRPRVIVL